MELFVAFSRRHDSLSSRAEVPDLSCKQVKLECKAAYDCSHIPLELCQRPGPCFLSQLDSLELLNATSNPHYPSCELKVLEIPCRVNSLSAADPFNSRDKLAKEQSLSFA